MYAVIETGGKQYRVEKGVVIRVEKLDVPEGEKIIFERVLLASNEGRIYAGPEAEKVKVEGVIVRHGREKKIIVFKYKPKKGYHRKKGHRQLFTEVRVDKITGGPRAARAKKESKEIEEAEEAKEIKVTKESKEIKEAKEAKVTKENKEAPVQAEAQMEIKEETQAEAS